MALTGEVIKQQIQNSATVDEFCEKLALAITENLEVKLPPGVVIIQVTGAAAGVPNPLPIACEIQ